MKNRKIFLNLSTIFCGIFAISSCTIINSQFNISFSGEDVSVDELQAIMEKYDEDFATQTYTGGKCVIELAHWDGDGRAIEMSVLNTMLKGFNIRYPDISVKLTILSDYDKVYSTTLLGSKVADVFLMPDGDVMQWAPLNVCEDLGPYLESSTLVDTSKMYQSSVLRYKYNFLTGRCDENGTTVALPKDIGPTVMYYNKSAFKKAGIPYPSNTEIMNLEDAFTMWSQLKQINNGVVKMYGVGGLSIEGLVWSCGGDFLNEERTGIPNEGTPEYKGLKEGYEYMQRSYVNMGHDNDQIQPPASWSSGSDASTLFSNQMLACYIGLKSKVTAFRKLQFDWDCCPVPAGMVYPTKNAWSGSVGYSMYNGSTHKEAAWKLIEYINSKEGQELLSATGFQIPVYPELAEQEDFIERESSNKPENFQCFLSAASEQPVGLWSYYKNQLWKSEVYDTYVEKVFDESGTPKSVDAFLAEVREHIGEKLK